MKPFHNLLVFSVNLVYKKELNFMIKVSETSSQGAVGFELRGSIKEECANQQQRSNTK